MSDFLVQLGANPQARRVIRTLGLPIPLPVTLRRADGPWEARPLADVAVAVGAAPGAEVLSAIALTLARAGASPLVAAEHLPAFADVGEAFGRRAAPLGEQKLAALVFDATGVERPESLRALFDFFQPLLGRLATSGRVVVVGRPPGGSAIVAATRAALEGFVRSLAKEIGKRGATAQLLVVQEGAEGRVEPVLRFVLSARAAFVTGQPIAVTMVAAGGGEPPFVRPLEGKVALVTGAARGIGEATARLLAGEGAQVVCLDRPADDGPASQVARAIGGRVLLADVSDPTAPQAIAHELRAGVDIVVHNAGVTRDKTLARMAPELWDQALDINLAAIARIDEALQVREGGRVVCLSSVAGIAGNVGQTNYAASKAGVIGYVRARGAELAGRGITVNAVAPGFIETRLTAAIPLMIREAGRRLSALGQGGLPRDVAEVITFVASPGAVGVTGGVLRVCGGSFMGA